MQPTDRLYIEQRCFRQDGGMPDWVRLGKYVVARRVELGFEQRVDFAAAAQITTRVISDLENGRRGNFDPVTVSKLEKTLGWETGSLQRVAAGGEPRLRGAHDTADETTLGDLLTTYRPTEDAALIRVMRSNLPDAKKRELVRMLIAEQERAARERTERAEQMIHLLGGDS